MDRAKYSACIGDAMRGRELTKEERKMAFCMASKICSGKSSSEEEARQICSLPKPPKEPKIRKQKTEAPPDNTCDLAQFLDVSSQFNNVYIGILGKGCTPCRELDHLIRQNEIPHPVVYVPETCEDILNQLGVEMLPTVIKMSKGKIVAKHEGSPETTIEAMKKGE